MLDFNGRSPHSGKVYSFWGPTVLDEFIVLNRALSSEEVESMVLSDSPFVESPGLTTISGNKIKTGSVVSENWSGYAGERGTALDLNGGRLTFRINNEDIFDIDAASSTAKLAG